jgi:hypothetical protein
MPRTGGTGLLPRRHRRQSTSVEHPPGTLARRPRSMVLRTVCRVRARREIRGSFRFADGTFEILNVSKPAPLYPCRRRESNAATVPTEGPHRDVRCLVRTFSRRPRIPAATSLVHSIDLQAKMVSAQRRATRQRRDRRAELCAERLEVSDRTRDCAESTTSSANFPRQGARST